MLFVWTAVWSMPPGAAVRWGGGAFTPTYSISSSPPFPSVQIHAQLLGLFLCVGSAMAYLTVPYPLGHNCSHGCPLRMPTSVELPETSPPPICARWTQAGSASGQDPPPRPPASTCPCVVLPKPPVPLSCLISHAESGTGTFGATLTDLCWRETASQDLRYPLCLAHSSSSPLSLCA